MELGLAPRPLALAPCRLGIGAALFRDEVDEASKPPAPSPSFAVPGSSPGIRQASVTPRQSPHAAGEARWVGANPRAIGPNPRAIGRRLPRPEEPAKRASRRA